MNDDKGSAMRYRLQRTLETMRPILGHLVLASNVGLRPNRRRPASPIRLHIGAVWPVFAMPLQGVLARELIMAATTLPRRRFVCEDALMPLQVTQSFTHLLAAGDPAWEAHCTGAGY
jgi:hypothetical protein